MEFTGERYCPEVKGEIAMEHYLRYLLAARLADGKDVLDIASGEGYGSALLAQKAKKVIGVDVSPEAVENAKSAYSAPNLEFMLGDASSIPLPDNSVDMVTSFETIEHHDRQEEMMSELRRVLRPGGLLMLSSPDRAMNEDLHGHNPFHVRELYKEELTDLVGKYFKNYSICGQRTIFASVVDGTEAVAPVIWPEEDSPNADTASHAFPDPKFFIILASDNDSLPAIPPALIEGAIKDAELYVHAQYELASTRNELTRAQDEWRKTFGHLQGALKAHADALGEINKLRSDLFAIKSENEGLSTALRGREAILQDMLNSRSWRMTAPIRAILKKVRKARQMLFFYPQIVKQKIRKKLNKLVSKDKTRVVLISGEKNTQGHIYRIERLAAALSPECNVEIIAGNDLPKDSVALRKACGADILWIWRCTNTNELQTAVTQVHKSGNFVIFDIDDMCFHPDHYAPEYMDAIRHWRMNIDELRHHGQNIFDLVCSAHFCIGTTTHLSQEFYRKTGKGVFTLRNTFDHAFRLRGVKARYAFLENKKDNIVRIGYASGTVTHQADLSIAGPALRNVLKKYPNARLVLFRTIDISEIESLRDMEDRIEWRDLVPYQDLPAELARFDINIIPLEIENPFCNSKSELKFFEAALMRIPSIASPTEPYCQCIRNGENGFLADTTSEWENALAALIEDPALRHKIGSAAQRTAIWRFGPEYLKHTANSIVDYVRGDSLVRSDVLSREIQDRPKDGTKPVAVCDYEVIYSTGQPCSRVSVVIPLHNYENYIVEALNSVYEQTLKDIDLIVVDDSSTDNSRQVARDWLEEHAGRFASVSLLANVKNAGLAVTRNVGFDYSESEFIMPLDADNKLLPECLEKCMKILDNGSGAFVFPQILTFGDDERIISGERWNPAILTCGNYIDAMAMVRKANWAAVGGYTNQRLGWEDYDLWCKFLEMGFYGAFAGEVLARYRVHSQSMVHTTTDKEDSNRIIREDMGARHPWLTLGSFEQRLEERKKHLHE